MRPTRWHFLLGVFVFGLAVLFGTQIVDRSWNGVVFVMLDSDERNPAAVPRQYDYSHLQGQAFELAAGVRLLKAAEIRTEDQQIGLALGQFVTRDQLGRKRLACQIYDRIALQFIGLGMATSSEVPTLEVEGPCRFSRDDIDHMATLWLPFAQLYASPARNIASLDVNTPNGPLSVKVENMADTWPTEWQLSEVLLKKVNGPEEPIVLSLDTIRSTLNEPIILRYEAAVRR